MCSTRWALGAVAIRRIQSTAVCFAKIVVSRPCGGLGIEREMALK